MEIRLDQVGYSTPYKKILENVSIKIKNNSITAIMGQSGSGKTTLAEIIGLLEIPTTGSVNFNSINNSKNNQLKSKIGIVFQIPEEQFFCSNVEKEIEFGLNYVNKDKKQIKKKVIDALTMVNMDISYLNRHTETLSNGEKRKVAIASILALNPEILILDEPTIGLDEASKNNLIKILRLLKQKYNKTIVVVTRDSEIVNILCDQVIIIDAGEVVLNGDKYDVFTSNIEKYNLKKPKVIEFEQKVLEQKGIKLLYRDDINDLMKDIYRSVK